jgi:hypothetical protein
MIKGVFVSHLREAKAEEDSEANKSQRGTVLGTVSASPGKSDTYGTAKAPGFDNASTA